MQQHEINAFEKINHMSLTPLQKTAREAISKWNNNHPLRDVAMIDLKNALNDELALVDLYFAQGVKASWTETGKVFREPVSFSMKSEGWDD